MSYSFVITVKDGKPSVDETAPIISVPDGKFQVSGHIPSPDKTDWDQESISVTRFDDKNIQVAQASAAVKRA